MLTFDLKSGYHHIDISPVQNKYLVFAWKGEGKTHLYVFTALHFGLATACFVLKNTLRPLVKYWNCTGLDDGISAAKAKDRADSASILVRKALVKAGRFRSQSSKSLEGSISNLQLARLYSILV